MIGAWIAIAIGVFTALALALGWFSDKKNPKVRGPYKKRGDEI